MNNDNNIERRSSTANLKHDHIIVKRVGAIAQRCSDKLYAGDDEGIPIEDIEILSVVIEEFIDAFHHGKEEKAYFPVTKSKDGYSEDIRKFLIEHELGRRIANMLRREIQVLKKSSYNQTATTESKRNEQDRTEMERRKKEPVARFLKSYVVFIDDHTGKEDIFFDLIERKESISSNEDRALLQHYEACKNEVGGQVRMEEMMRLIEYLENRDWMKDGSK